MTTSAAFVSVPALTVYAERMQRAIAPIVQMAETLKEAGSVIAEALAVVKAQNRRAWKAFTEALAQKRLNRFRPASKPSERDRLEGVDLETVSAFKASERNRRRCRSLAFPDGFLIDLATSPHGPPESARTTTRPPP